MIRRGRFGKLEDGLPGPDSPVLVVHPVPGLGHPEERRGGHFGIVEADHTLVGREGLGVVAGLDEGGRLVEELARRHPIQRARHVTVDGRRRFG